MDESIKPQCFSFLNGDYELCSQFDTINQRPTAIIRHFPTNTAKSFNCVHSAATISPDEAADFYTDPTMKVQKDTLKAMKMIGDEEYRQIGITCDMRLQGVNSYLEGIAQIFNENPKITEVFDQLVEMDKGIGSVDYSLNGQIAGFVAQHDKSLEKSYLRMLWKKHRMDDVEEITNIWEKQQTPNCRGLITDLEKFYGDSVMKYVILTGAKCQLSPQMLSLADNKLQSLPAEIGQLNKLQSLYLHNNQLQSLPVEIGQLKELQSLDLYNNQLQSLPQEIGQLKKLESLYLQNNPLQSLPSSLCAKRDKIAIYIDQSLSELCKK
jgi:hypothetical protein